MLFSHGAQSSVFTSSFLLAFRKKALRVSMCSVPLAHLLRSEWLALWPLPPLPRLPSEPGVCPQSLATGLILCPALQAGGSSCNFSHGPCSPMARCASEITAFPWGVCTSLSRHLPHPPSVGKLHSTLNIQLCPWFLPEGSLIRRVAVRRPAPGPPGRSCPCCSNCSSGCVYERERERMCVVTSHPELRLFT